LCFPSPLKQLQDVSNSTGSFNKECNDKAKALTKAKSKSNKRNVATIQSSSLVVHKKKTVSKSTNTESKKQCESKLPQPTKVSSTDISKSKPSANHNQDAPLALSRSITLESSAERGGTAKDGNVKDTKPSTVSNTNTTDGDELQSYQYSHLADDIDARDSDDPLCATTYVQDMYKLFRSKEVSTSVRPLYMENQPYINQRMRSILVDWLVEVHLKFKLVPETLYLTVNLIDRYLAKTEVSRAKVQLVGVTALLIASKYEEIYPPELRDLVFICDGAYSKVEVCRYVLCMTCFCFILTPSYTHTYISLHPTSTDLRYGRDHPQDA